MAIFAYGRVSTRDQTSQNQRQDIEKSGIKVDYWFADEGISGKTHASQRPQFKALDSSGLARVNTQMPRKGRVRVIWL